MDGIRFHAGFEINFYFSMIFLCVSFIANCLHKVCLSFRQLFIFSLVVVDCWEFARNATDLNFFDKLSASLNGSCQIMPKVSYSPAPLYLLSSFATW